VRSLVRSSHHFGGVTHEWLFDNPRSIVVAREGRAIRFQDDLVELAGQLHVALRACRVRTPTDKGGVERAIRYLKTRFFPARTITSLESGNAALREFLETVALERRHPTDREKSVREVLASERERLLPLPKADIPTETITTVPADKTAFITFDTNRYSVPSGAANRVLQLAASDTELRLSDNNGFVATHVRSWSKSQRFTTPEHREDILKGRPAARDGTGRERLRLAVPKASLLLERWLDDGRHVGPLVARTLKLLDIYGASVLGKAVEELLERGSHDYGALAMLCEKRRKGPRKSMPLEIGAHVVERDVIPQDLGGYDDDSQ